MSLFDNFSLRDTVNFEVYPSAILGTGFRGVKIVGILDAGSARGWIDPDALHVQVYPTLPAGVPNDPERYEYLKLELPNGGYTCVGVPWIRADTMEVLERSTVRLTVDNVPANDHQRIVNTLSALGYGNVQLEIL